MAYSKDSVALKGISFQIEDGEFVFITGPSGAGKSSIIHLLTCENFASEGKLIVAGTNLKSLSHRQIAKYRRKIGVVFQDFRLIDGMNVYDPKNAGMSDISPIATISDGNDFFAMKNVPHGAVSQRYYFSKTLNTWRRMHVWTPAGYETSKKKLPVLYLIHGGGDTDNSWPGVGAAGMILDNLLAEAIIVE